MKKIISILVAVMMSVAVCTVGVAPAMALTIGSIESADKDMKIEITVNGEDSIHGEYEDISEAEKDKGYEAVIDFIYKGSSPIIYWEIKDLVFGEDYIILEETPAKLQVAILKDTINYVWANAVTKDPSTNKTPVKSDNSKTSPKTGVATFGGVAALAGAVVIGASRKKR